MRFSFNVLRLTFAVCLAAVSLGHTVQAQEIAFTADQTPPSASTTPPQVTVGPTSSAVNLGSVSVCPYLQPITGACTEQETLLYTVTQGGTFLAPIAVTEGVAGQDFNIVSSTCSGMLATNAQCTVTFRYTPLQAGLRRGAIVFPSGGATPIATTYLYGIGAGPSVAFVPATEQNITTGLNQPAGVAVNAQGDVFYVDIIAGTLYKVPYNAHLTQVALISGLLNPSAVALDGAGNLFVTDTGHQVVLKIPPAGGPGTTIGGGFHSPNGIAVNGAGDVFVSDSTVNLVLRIPISGGPQATYGAGYASPSGLAVDLAGNLFVADTLNARVLKIAPGGGAQTTVGTGFHAPISVAVDPAGNVYVGDTGADGIVEVPADGSLQFPVGNGFITPTGLTLANNGDLYVADYSRAEVVQLLRSGPPNFVFANTAVGSVSSDSPVFIRVENIGTAPLFIGASPTTIDPNFVLVHGPAIEPYCTAGLTVGVGGECVIQISFQPKSVGTFTSAYVLNSNNLNTDFNESIGVQGSGTGITTQIKVNGPSGGYYGASAQLFPISNSPAPFLFAVVSGPATISSTGLITPTNVGPITISVSQLATGNYSAATSYFNFFCVRAGTFSTMTVTPVKSGFGTAARIEVTVHPDTSGVPTGTVRIVDGSVELARVPLVNGVATYTTGQLTGGTHDFGAFYLGTDLFDVSFASGQLVVASTQVTLRVFDPTVPYPLPTLFYLHVQPSGQEPPYGRITILDGTVAVASFQLPAFTDGNLLELIPKPLKPGLHVLTAYYAGDAKYPPGVSNAVSVTVTPAD